MATIQDGETTADRFVFAVIRGDMDVNETKLANAVRARDLRPAREEEIRAIGAEPGYGSPVGVQDALVVVDDLVPQAPNLVAGANERGYHLRHVNYGRDYAADIVADIAAARAGDPCPQCAAPLRASGGVEVGNIFKLGTRYTESLGATFLDREGKAQHVIMGSYGIGAGRLLACIAEEHHDAYGLTWPISVAPFAVHLVSVPGGQADIVATRLYADLQAAGVEILYDDRDERPGVKFMDADLIGNPLRLTVGERALARGGVEIKPRTSKDATLVPVEEVVARVQAEIAALEAALAARVVSVPFVG